MKKENRSRPNQRQSDLHLRTGKASILLEIRPLGLLHPEGMSAVG